MKQRDIVLGRKYILARMQEHPELNGTEVTVVHIKSGRSDKGAYYLNQRGRKPAHYFTDIGQRVMACNLEAIDR